jgi:hypothetical protein
VAEKPAIFFHSRVEFFSFIFIVILLRSTPISKALTSWYNELSNNKLKIHTKLRETSYDDNTANKTCNKIERKQRVLIIWRGTSIKKHKAYFWFTLHKHRSFPFTDDILSLSLEVYVPTYVVYVESHKSIEAQRLARFIFYDMMYLLTAIGLTPGGSSTVHIYTQTIHRTTKKIHRTQKTIHRTTQKKIPRTTQKQYIEQPKNIWNSAGRASSWWVYPGICLTTEEKARKNLSQGSIHKTSVNHTS